MGLNINTTPVDYTLVADKLCSPLPTFILHESLQGKRHGQKISDQKQLSRAYTYCPYSKRATKDLLHDSKCLLFMFYLQNSERDVSICRFMVGLLLYLLLFVCLVQKIKQKRDS